MIMNDAQEMLPSDLETLLIEKLSSSGACTRDQLVNMLHMPRTTIYDALKKLIIKGQARKYPDPEHDGRGRPVVMFEIVNNNNSNSE